MKRILTCLLLILSFSVSSQTEIWGTKYHAGMKNGGVLFSIDSATNQLITHYRFENYNYQLSSREIPPFYDENENIWLVAERNQILIYYPAIDLIESVDYDGSQYVSEGIKGKFHKGKAHQYYILHKKGVLKIDIVTKEVKLIESQYSNRIPLYGVDFCRVEHKLYWHQGDNYSDLLIFSLEIQTDSIELVYQKEQDIDLFGKLNYLDGKLYGIYQSNKSTIYSFDLKNDVFKIEKEIANNEFKNTTGLQLANDQKLYVGGNDGTLSYISKLASYNPVNDSFTICASYVNYYGQNMLPDFFAFDEEGFYLQFSETDQVYANIQRYNFNTDTLIEVISNNHYGHFLCIEQNKVITIHSKSVTPYGQYLFEFDLLTGEVDTLKKILSPKFEEGMYPKKIIQLDNGLIIGNTARGGVYSGDYYNYISKSKGVVFQFDPALKDYRVLFDINKDFNRKYTSSTIFENNGNNFWLQMKNKNSDNFHLFGVNAETLQIDSIGIMPNGIYYQESPTEFYIYDDDYLIKYNISGEYDTLYLFNDYDLLKILKSNSEYLILETWYREDSYHYEYQIQKFYLSDYRLELNKTLILPKEFEEGYPCRIDNLIMTADSNLVGIVYENNEETKHKRLVKYYLDSDSIRTLRRNSYGGAGSYSYALDLIYFDDYDLSGNAFSLSFSTKGNNGQLDLLDFKNDTVIKLDEMEEMTTDYDCESNSCGSKFVTRFKPTLKSFIWIGKVSSDWFNPENWQFYQVPDTSASVYLKGFTPYDPIIDSLVKIKSIIVNEDANLVIGDSGRLSCENMVNKGSFRMQANNGLRASAIFSQSLDNTGTEIISYQQNKNIDQLFAIPLQLNTINKNEQFDLFRYYEGNWEPISDFPYIHPANNALDIFSTDSSFVFYGPINFENQTLNVPQLNNNTLYPLPNPYPSSVKWNKANISSLTYKAFYYFDEQDSSFSAYVDGLGNHSPLIRPLDAFWVWSSGEESIHLDQSSRLHEEEFEEKKPDKTYVSLQVNGAKGKDETVIGFNEQAGFDFDPEYDAFKFIRTTKQAPHIFTKTGEDLLTVNQIPDTSMMDFYVLNGEDATLRIKLLEKSNIDFLVLEDLIWNSRTDLLKEDYSFDYFKTDKHYPFKLYFEPWTLEPLEEADVYMYFHLDKLVINARKQVDFAEISFYDLAGRLILEFKESNFFHLEEKVDIPAGHYIVQFRSGEVVSNLKVFVI